MFVGEVCLAIGRIATGASTVTGVPLITLLLIGGARGCSEVALQHGLIISAQSESTALQQDACIERLAASTLHKACAGATTVKKVNNKASSDLIIDFIIQVSPEAISHQLVGVIKLSHPKRFVRASNV